MRVWGGARSLPWSGSGVRTVRVGRLFVAWTCVRATEKRRLQQSENAVAAAAVGGVLTPAAATAARTLSSPTATRNVRARMHDGSPSARHRCQIEISLPLRTRILYYTKNDIVRLSLGSSSSQRFTLDGVRLLYGHRGNVRCNTIHKNILCFIVIRTM